MKRTVEGYTTIYFIKNKRSEEHFSPSKNTYSEEKERKGQI
jgi:hypothetical protein